MTDKRVPREPTQAMEQAAYDLIPIAPGTETWAIGRYPHPDKLWQAMYDAAPAVPDERDTLKAALRRVAIHPLLDRGAYCLLCKGSWAHDRPGGEWHEPGCLAAPEDAP